MNENETQTVERLAVIETKLDHITEKLTDTLGKMTDHESRIRKLEKAVWVAAGAGVAGGGVLGALFQSLAGV